MYDGGNLTQETCGVETNDESDFECERTMVNGANLYIDCNSQLQTICNLIENDAEISYKFRSKFSAMVTECRSDIMLKKKDKSNVSSEWISSMPEVDTNTVCKQKVACTELVGSKKGKKYNSITRL